MNLKDVVFETMRGQGPGGQHRNKTDSCVRATHIPTGISVIVDGRKQGQNKKKAIFLLEQKLDQFQRQKKAEVKKDRRDKAIHDTPIIRTYNYSRGVVKDHRTGKIASLKEVMQKGKFSQLTEGLK